MCCKIQCLCACIFCLQVWLLIPHQIISSLAPVCCQWESVFHVLPSPHDQWKCLSWMSYIYSCISQDFGSFWDNLERFPLYVVAVFISPVFLHTSSICDSGHKYDINFLLCVFQYDFLFFSQVGFVVYYFPNHVSAAFS